MRIAILSWRDTAHPQAGGSELVIDRLAEGLTERNHQVTLLHGGPSAEHDYPAFRTGGDFTQYVLAPFTFWRRARDTEVLIDLENGIPFFSPLWQRRPVVCMILHIHVDQWSMRFPRPISTFGRWLETRVMPFVYRHATFATISPSTTEALQKLGIRAGAITTLELGIDFHPLEPKPSHEPRFVILGRLVPHKRIDLALRMWERVRPEIGGALVIIGDGPELERLKAMSVRGVEFLGRVDEQQKRDELARAWLLIHPAHHEGWGMVVMEAAVASVPTLAFDVPGVRDSVQDGVTGVLVDVEDEFVAEWIALAKNNPRRHAMALEARNRAAMFTWSRTLDSLESLLKEVQGQVK